jgi:hypothetical protein
MNLDPVEPTLNRGLRRFHKLRPRGCSPRGRNRPARTRGLSLHSAIRMTILDVPQPPDLSPRGDLILRLYPGPLVDGVCKQFGGLDPTRPVLACAVPMSDVGKCLVILPRPRDIGKANYARIKNNGLGHCAGWERRPPVSPPDQRRRA